MARQNEFKKKKDSFIKEQQKKSEKEQAKQCTFQPNQARSSKSKGHASSRAYNDSNQSKQTDPSQGQFSNKTECIQSSQKARSSQKFI